MHINILKYKKGKNIFKNYLTIIVYNNLSAFFSFNFYMFEFVILNFKAFLI